MAVLTAKLIDYLLISLANRLFIDNGLSLACIYVIFLCL